MKKMKATNLYEEAARRLAELKEYQSLLNKRLNNSPEENLHITCRNGFVEFYLRPKDNLQKEKYISNKKMKFLKPYIQKKYDLKTKKLVDEEIKAIEKFLKSALGLHEQIRDIYANAYLKIKTEIEPIDITDDDFIMEWMAQSYDKKPMMEDAPIYLTEREERVRSKSELNIANELNKNHIPYKYECPLLLRGGLTIYPDFTVLDVKNRKVVYWEHRGMMDDREYVKNTVRRIKEYETNNIFLGKELIITEEYSNLPLGTNEIKRIIERYFK